MSQNHKYDVCDECFENLRQCLRCGHFVCANEKCKITSHCPIDSFTHEHAVARLNGLGSSWRTVRKAK